MLIIVYPLEIASDKKKERTPPAYRADTFF